jgi:hypothetical protein
MNLRACASVKGHRDLVHKRDIEVPGEIEESLER